jgi:hypothetical protein
MLKARMSEVHNVWTPGPDTPRHEMQKLDMRTSVPPLGPHEARKEAGPVKGQSQNSNFKSAWEPKYQSITYFEGQHNISSFIYRLTS